MERPFVTLRIIATIHKVIGVIVGLVTVLLTLGICATSVLGGAAMDSVGQEFGNVSGFGFFSGILGGLIFSFLAIISGASIAIFLYGFGELIYLFLAIEENTRTAKA